MWPPWRRWRGRTRRAVLDEKCKNKELRRIHVIGKCVRSSHGSVIPTAIWLDPIVVATTRVPLSFSVLSRSGLRMSPPNGNRGAWAATKEAIGAANAYTQISG